MGLLRSLTGVNKSMRQDWELRRWDYSDHWAGVTRVDRLSDETIGEEF
jgi:hypothetical protein